ncbi:Auxin Efflux Carrier family protein [Tritrichomonas foetus]|uniref:Auxin Efflux Carrier family protein n=1 Tax=Tritrichomonas foetus TaxID=1144522 RepID=A0A1J4KXP6_9EUKA|nr:Auxin Efflux Carrier family protein [Tritrichomonas foetus]|eukprot:OHT16007.1 Auxin Efflux Carrier family protein [Tritrichomonas foetus]
MAGAEIDYLDSFQVSLCVVFIVAIGYMCGGFKMFTSKHASEIRRALFLICIPGLMFRQIAKRPLDLESWQPFFNGILVQLTIHIVYALIVLIFPFRNKRKKFLEISYSTSVSNFLYFASPFIQYFYSDQYIYIPIFQALVHFVILIPTYTLFGYLLGERESPDSMGSSTRNSMRDENSTLSHSSSSQSVSSLSNSAKKEESHKKSKKITKSDASSNEEEEIELEEGIENGPAEPVIPIEDIVGHNEDPENINDKKLLNNDHLNLEDSENSEHSGKSKNTEIHQVPDNGNNTKNMPLKWAMFWTFVNTTNVCAILGIIWSATKWEMITFVEEFTIDLQKAVFGAGLFIVGVFMWEYPLRGLNIVKVLIYNLIHFIFVPLVSLLWCYVCKVDKITSIICVLSHAAPLGLFGHIMASNSGYNLKDVSYTFFWSNVAFLPMIMLWVIVFNEISIFND